MPKHIDEYFVPWLKDKKMYVSNHIELAWDRPELHRMMSNENPFAPSEKVLEAIRKYGEMANRYPDQGLVVRSRIAEINGLDGPENVMLGNGSSEVYDMVWRSLLGVDDEIIQHTPCFGIYKLRAGVLGAKLVSAPMKQGGDGLLYFDPDAILAAVTAKTKAIVIANPNNPTGNFMDADQFERIARTGIPLIVDEAYVEFAGLGRSQVGLIKKYNNVLITRTLSKAYGLAGLRFGYLLSSKVVIDRIASTLIPWNMGTIPMWAGLAALEDTEALDERVRFNNDQVRYIGEELSEVSGLTVLPSYGNYILMNGAGAGKKGEDMVAYALEKGIIIRPQGAMYGTDGWFRITIGSAEENQMCVEVIKEFFAS